MHACKIKLFKKKKIIYKSKINYVTNIKRDG